MKNLNVWTWLNLAAIASAGCIDHQNLGDDDGGGDVHSSILDVSNVGHDANSGSDGALSDAIRADTSRRDVTTTGMDVAIDTGDDASATDDTTTVDDDAANAGTITFPSPVVQCAQDTVSVYCRDPSANIIAIHKSDRTIHTLAATNCNASSSISTDGTHIYWACVDSTNTSPVSIWSLPVTGGSPTQIGATTMGLLYPRTFASNNQVYFSCGATHSGHICVAPSGSTTPDPATGAFGTTIVGPALDFANPRIPGVEGKFFLYGTSVYYYYPGSNGGGLSAIYQYDLTTSSMTGSWSVQAGAFGTVWGWSVNDTGIYVLQPEYVAPDFTQPIGQLSRLPMDGRMTTLNNWGLPLVETPLISQNDAVAMPFVDDEWAYVWGSGGLRRASIDGPDGPTPTVVETIDPSTSVTDAFTDATSIYWVDGNSLKMRTR